jgi:putative FmdB family regulatory protein
MPTYEYACTHCGHNFELFQKITDKHIEKCPQCHKKVKRLIGRGSGIIFKGSGFYSTDYRKKPDTCPQAAKEGCNACPQNKNLHK